MGLIDTHAHLYEPEYVENMDALMGELRQNGMENVICVGCEIATSERTLEIADKYDFVYAAVGFHPCDVGEITDEMWEKMKKLMAHPKVKAVGEIGLDYYWDKVPRDIQKHWFIKQLDYANEIGLPVAIHTRDATMDTMEILREHTPKRAFCIVIPALQKRLKRW